jgi:hypothetical protein
MRLINASHFGDTEVAYDAYDLLAPTFKVGFDAMSFSKIDGVSVNKRAVSITPSVVLPLRGALAIDNRVYLFGNGAPDYWKGKVIRRTIIIQGADGLANLTSISGALMNLAPSAAYAALVFSKYMPESIDNSKYPPQYQIFLSGTESAPADSLVELNSAWYLIKQSYISTSGLRIALANELDSPIFETVSFGARAYDPYTDDYISTGHSIKVLRVRWSEHFTYLSKASVTFERGDVQIFIGKDHMPKSSDTLTLSDGVWRILSVQDDMNVWSCHARRA